MRQWCRVGSHGFCYFFIFLLLILLHLSRPCQGLLATCPLCHPLGPLLSCDTHYSCPGSEGAAALLAFPAAGPAQTVPIPCLPHGSCSDRGPPDPSTLTPGLEVQPRAGPSVIARSLAELSHRREQEGGLGPSSGRLPLQTKAVLQGPPVHAHSMRTRSLLAGPPSFSVAGSFSHIGEREHGVLQSPGAMSALCIGSWTPGRLVGQLTHWQHIQ